MKNLVLALAIVFSLSTFAQKVEKEKKATVPAIVKSAFANDYPATKAKWGKEDENFEAEFELNGVDASAVYDKLGNKKELEVEIKTNNLPLATLDYLKKNYPNNKVKEAAKITNDKNVVTYEAEIKKDNKSYDILFDSKGKFIKIVAGD
jgi:hypothetical protein